MTDNAPAMEELNNNCADSHSKTSTPSYDSESDFEDVISVQSGKFATNTAVVGPAAMTGQSRTPEAPSPGKSQKQKKDKSSKQVAIPSKSRQKKFHRHFSQVDENELVLNYYSCALIADILLQGHLYITKNYFAFYSNVFGYVTKLLIPTASVLRISKEKTGRIFPNAVGITTEDDKHVFGSLMSRESTYNFLLRVWNSAVLPEPEAVIIPAKELNEFEVSEASIEEEDESSSHTDNEVTITANIDSRTTASSGSVKKRKSHRSTPDECIVHTDPACSSTPLFAKCTTTAATNTDQHLVLLVPPAGVTRWRRRLATIYSTLCQLSHDKQTLLASVLLVISFITTLILIYKISTVHQRRDFHQVEMNDVSDESHKHILRLQALLQERSADEISLFLNGNLEQIRKIKESLTDLSLVVGSTTVEEEPNVNS